MTTWRQREVPTHDGAILVTQSVGDPGAPTMVLVGAATWSLDWWDDALCELLADQGLQVLRYDHRDTVGSTTSPVGAPPYGPADLVTDVVAVLDGHGVARAHLLGLSMGGGIVQAVAAVTNHFIVIGQDTAPVERAAITAPALVVHGSHDPLLPPEHGQALARALGAGDVVVLPDTGHQAPPPDTWPRLVAAVRTHVTGA